MESPFEDKIHAIKTVRQISGLSLYDSKQIVDALFPPPLRKVTRMEHEIFVRILDKLSKNVDAGPSVYRSENRASIAEVRYILDQFTE